MNVLTQYLHKKTALIIGGTSGLGLELAQLLHHQGYRTVVAGRRKPEVDGISVEFLDMSGATTADLADRIAKVLEAVGHVNLLVYAPGFYQEGTLDELSSSDINDMMNVGLNGCTLALNHILSQQRLEGFIAITSTSQWTPRLTEPVYTAVKAGLAMLANSLSLDPNVGKVLVGAPAGMATRFWEGTERDLTSMLEPRWVAEEMLKAYQQDFKYLLIRILREPPRIEVVERR